MLGGLSCFIRAKEGYPNIMNEILSGWKNNFQKKYNRIVILKINLLDQKTKYLQNFLSNIIFLKKLFNTNK